MSNYRSAQLKDLAREVEVCPFCDRWAPLEIVGCHPNGLKYGKGMGLKADDLVAYLCPECHDILDGRAGGLTRFEKDCMFLEAFYASMLWAFREGHLRVIR